MIVIDTSGAAQLITSIATLIGVIGGLFVSLRNGQKADAAKVEASAAKAEAAETKAVTQSVEKKVDAVHEVATNVVTVTNGLQDKLIEATAKASEAIGLAKGLQQGRDEQRT